eukprot:scaffold29974_cov60-Cyclotella_meneghiniana.AAC.1
MIKLIIKWNRYPIFRIRCYQRDRTGQIVSTVVSSAVYDIDSGLVWLLRSAQQHNDTDRTKVRGILPATFTSVQLKGPLLRVRSYQRPAAREAGRCGLLDLIINRVK